MKLKDIQIGQDVAAPVKHYTSSKGTLLRCRVESLDDRYVVLWVHEWQERRRVYFTTILSSWSEYQVAQAKLLAKRERERSRQRAAWDAKRAEERQRFEEHILPAFAGLDAPDRNKDLAAYIKEMMVDGGSSTVTLRESDLRRIADRITELSSIVAQSALTAQDLPQAGWGVTPEQVAAEAERIGKLNEAGLSQPERTVIEIPLSRLGLGDA